MNKKYIFVEEKEDKDFLESYARFLNLECVKVESSGSKSELLNAQNRKYTSKKENGDQVYIIADYDHDKDHLNKKIEELEADKVDGVFFIKNNLEDLLLSIAKQKNKVECFKKYEKCIEKEISLKGKLYAYLDSCYDHSKKSRQELLNYFLYFELESNKLDSLKNFLVNL